MKLIVEAILSLALLELFHCAPLIGSDDGTYTETHTSSSWGIKNGLGDFGLEGGYEGGYGLATLRTKNHPWVNFGVEKENGESNLKHTVAAASPPKNFGSGYGSTYGTPNRPVNGSPYYIQNALQPPLQYPPHFTKQPIQQYPLQQAPHPQYPIPQTDFKEMYTKRYVSKIPPYIARYNTPYGITQRTPVGSPTSMPQYGTLYGLTDICWYDDGSPYKPDDTTYHPSVTSDNTYFPLYNPLTTHSCFGTPYNPYHTTYYPFGSPYNSYNIMTYKVYTPSGQIHCSPYGRPASLLDYPLSYSCGMPVPDISTKFVQKPIFRETDTTVDKPLNKILDKPIDNLPNPLIKPLINISSKTLNEPSRKYLDKTLTNSAESASENLSDYATVSPFDDMPTEKLFDMTTVNPFDNAIDDSLETARNRNE